MVVLSVPEGWETYCLSYLGECVCHKSTLVLSLLEQYEIGYLDVGDLAQLVAHRKYDRIRSTPPPPTFVSHM